jgi:hypothetical protein
LCFESERVTKHRNSAVRAKDVVIDPSAKF